MLRQLAYLITCARGRAILCSQLRERGGGGWRKKSPLHASGKGSASQTCSYVTCVGGRIACTAAEVKRFLTGRMQAMPVKVWYHVSVQRCS